MMGYIIAPLKWANYILSIAMYKMPNGHQLMNKPGENW